MKISVKNLKKHFKVKKKAQGFGPAIKNIFSPEYKNIKAVDGVTFKINSGEIVGFIGPNGAGKTTTLKMLAGIMHPSQGEVDIGGFIPWARKKNFLKKISFVMGQKSQLWEDLPAVDTFKLNQEIYELDEKEYKETISELINIFNLEEIKEQQVRKLSLGQRMKCEIAASLIHKPEIIFLDEPTIGLDVIMQRRLRKFIKEYNRKYNSTVMLTSHNMDDVKEICDRVIVINKGKLIFDGLLQDLIKEHANYKVLRFLFNEQVNGEDFTRYGKILECKDYEVVLSVDPDEVGNIISKVVEQYSIDDIDIDEPRLEDVIEEVFEG